MTTSYNNYIHWRICVQRGILLQTTLLFARCAHIVRVGVCVVHCSEYCFSLFRVLRTQPITIAVDAPPFDANKNHALVKYALIYVCIIHQIK